MKIVGRVVLVVLLMTGAGIGQVQAAGGSIDVTLASGYLFRGLLLNDEAVLQPMVTVSADNGFAFYTWANMDLTDQNMFGNDQPGQFSEVDLTIEYTPPLKIQKTSVTVGLAQYLYPNVDAPSTRELYAILAFDVLLSPMLSLYFDVDDASGAFYGNLKIGHSINMNKFTLGASASIGWANSDYNGYYIGINNSAVNDLTVGTNAGYPITEAIAISASATYSTLLDPDADNAAQGIYYNDGDVLVGTIGISFAF